MGDGGGQYEVPFKLWFLFTEKRRREREASHTLVRSFRRIRIRKLLFKIMRYWRHQVRAAASITGRRSGD